MCSSSARSATKFVLLVLALFSLRKTNGVFLFKLGSYMKHRLSASSPLPLCLSVPRKSMETGLTTPEIRLKPHALASVLGPPTETKPDYESIVGPLGKGMDNIFMKLFREKLAEQVGKDSKLLPTDYEAIIELAVNLNRNEPNRQEIHRRAQQVLLNLFPSWMPSSYSVLFSRPFPAFSARMNAWATKFAGTWLMGECEINDVERTDSGHVGMRQGLLVKRCRFLEESGCASVCVNSCKIPTQNFFLHDMGLPLTMEPNYETFECQFSFGLSPTNESELEAKRTPCLSRCPSAGLLREFHVGNSAPAVSFRPVVQCDSMDNP